jgi:predicted nucleic acid-binding protein
MLKKELVGVKGFAQNLRSQGRSKTQENGYLRLFSHVAHLVTDTALAAVALEINAILCSTDRDFRRFRDLRELDPFQQTWAERDSRPSR